MCGIAGFVAGTNGRRLFVCKEELQKMGDVLIHRGPDDSGIWFDSNIGVGFAHRRLSIIDTSNAGNQPMVSSTGRYRISFNGEVYNHIEIRKELEACRDINWKSTSDTETLLEAFEVWGINAAIQKFIGMFAISLWDHKDRCLYLVRDRVGEKPLYYGWQNNIFLFGSELKALRSHSCFENNMSRKNLALYMRYSYVPDPHSIYENIYKLLPATILKLQLGSKEHLAAVLPKPEYYWSLKEAFLGGKNKIIKDSSEAVDGLKKHLKDSIRLQSRSDVPLGAFLSGGTDSSTIVALLQEHNSKPVKTFTIGFENQEYNEAKDASTIANFLGTNHTEYYVNSAEALDVIPKLSRLYDEPFSDSSQIPTYIVSRLAASEVTVSLSGDGGDELFGGYNRYISVPRIFNSVKWMPHRARTLAAKSLERLPVDAWQMLGNLFGVKQAPEKVQKLLSIIGSADFEEVYAKLTSHWMNEDEVVLGTNSDHFIDSTWMNGDATFTVEEKMMYQDVATYLLGDILTKVDRAAMGVSLETRVPFLDHRVLEYTCRIPLNMKIRDGSGKWLLKQILEQYLPTHLIEKPKMGFGVPIDEWLRGPLRDWAEDLLNENRLEQEGIFNVQKVRSKWCEHLNRSSNWQHHLWDVLMFQAWSDAH